MKADYKKQKSALLLALWRCKNRVGARAVREKMSGFYLLASKKKTRRKGKVARVVLVSCRCVAATSKILKSADSCHVTLLTA